MVSQHLIVGVREHATGHRLHSQDVEVSARYKLDIQRFRVAAVVHDSIYIHVKTIDSGDTGKHLVLLRHLPINGIRKQAHASVREAVAVSGGGGRSEKNERSWIFDRQHS